MGDFMRQGQGPGFTPPFNPAAQPPDFMAGTPDLGQLLFPMLLSMLGGQGQGQMFGMPLINQAVGGAQGAGPAAPGGASAPTSGGTPMPGAGGMDGRQFLEQMLRLGMASSPSAFGKLF